MSFIFSALLLTAQSVPTALMNQVAKNLYDPDQMLDHFGSTGSSDRIRRAAGGFDMCSQNMQNITKLARVAGEIFMSVDDSPLYRRARNHVSYVNLEQPGRYTSNNKHLNFIHIFKYN